MTHAGIGSGPRITVRPWRGRPPCSLMGDPGVAPNDAPERRRRITFPRPTSLRQNGTSAWSQVDLRSGGGEPSVR
jgi:hypothetical protein